MATTTHEELNAARVLQGKIDRLQARLDDLRETGGIGAPSTNTPVMGGYGVFPGQLAAERAQEITDLQKQFEIERVIIGRHIDKLGLDDVKQKILRLYFVECWPNLDLVADAVGYTGEDGKATRQFYRIYENAKKTAGNDSTRQYTGG